MRYGRSRLALLRLGQRAQLRHGTTTHPLAYLPSAVLPACLPAHLPTHPLTELPAEPPAHLPTRLSLRFFCMFLTLAFCSILRSCTFSRDGERGWFGLGR